MGSEADALRVALEEAHLPTLLAAMATLSGEDRWLREEWRPRSTRSPEDEAVGGLPDTVQREIREAAFDLIMSVRNGRPAADPPSPERLSEWLEISLGPGQTLPKGMGALLAEELGLASRTVKFDAPAADELTVVVVGGGIGGLCAGIQLLQAGVAFTILEKNADLGGTWFENSYPGAGVDTPSHLYSFSFAQRGDWPRYFAGRDDVHAYLDDVAASSGIEEHIRFGVEVESLTWSEADRLWTVVGRDTQGQPITMVANVVISATGYLNRPKLPDIDGLESFTGPCVHPARWPSDLSVENQRVAIVGSGASAMQILPAIAGIARSVTVFQRTPQWAVPNADRGRAVSDAIQHLMQEVPYYLGWYRLRLLWNFGDRLFPALKIDPDWTEHDRSVSQLNDRHRRILTAHIERELGDRADLIAACVPAYPPYGKRPLLDHGWYRALVRDDVELIAEGVTKVLPGAVVTESGREVEADVLVLATGFENLNLLAPIDVRGRSGKSLRETWGDDDATAHLGMSVPDFPNLFILFGPNTVAGHGGSGVLTLELQVRYVMTLLARMTERRITALECRQEVHDDYVAALDAALETMVWSHPGTTTYYRNRRGRVVSAMPWTNARFWQLTHEPDLADFHAEPAQQEEAR